MERLKVLLEPEHFDLDHAVGARTPGAREGGAFADPPCSGVVNNGVVRSDQLIVAGYVLVVPTERPSAPGFRGLPATFLTISDCLMDELPRPECWDWYLDRHEAERARMSAAPQSENLTVAMTSADAAAFMSETGGARQPYFDLLRTETRLQEHVSVLGYEVVGAEETLAFHSWNCHGYLPGAVDELGTEINKFGLISTYEHAARVLEWMLAMPSDRQPAPVPWTVAALART